MRTYLGGDLNILSEQTKKMEAIDEIKEQEGTVNSISWLLIYIRTMSAIN